MKNVKLPKEVAEAIETLRENYWSNSCIYGAAIENKIVYSRLNDSVNSLRNYLNGTGSNDKLMDALVSGYEIERTPEDNLREYYSGLPRGFGKYEVSERYFIVKTLNTLGIKIKGINGDETVN